MVLLESIGSKVYHITYLSSFYNILKNNKMLTSVKYLYDQDVNTQKETYFVSFSTNYWSGYSDMVYDNDENPLVIMEIDGDKLGQRYKGKPVNSFARNSLDINGEYNFDPYYDENEVRVVTKKQELKNFNDYILTAYIYLDPKKHKESIKYLQNVLVLLDELNIPFKYFSDLSKFKTGKYGSADILNIEKMEHDLTEYEKSLESYYSRNQKPYILIKDLLASYENGSLNSNDSGKFRTIIQLFINDFYPIRDKEPYKETYDKLVSLLDKHGSIDALARNMAKTTQIEVRKKVV